MDTIELKIKGMSCGSCVSSVTHALQRVPGVDAVDVDLARGIARVSGNAQAAPRICPAGRKVTVTSGTTSTHWSKGNRCNCSIARRASSSVYSGKAVACLEV